jgi:hypothetical protein
MTLEELIQTLRMAAVSENTITAMTNAYNLGLEEGRQGATYRPVAVVHDWKNSGPYLLGTTSDWPAVGTTLYAKGNA